MKNKTVVKKKKIKDKIFYTVEGLSEELDLTPVAIRRYLREGKIPGIKIGQRWMVSEDNLLSYLNSASNIPEEKNWFYI